MEDIFSEQGMVEQKRVRVPKGWWNEFGQKPYVQFSMEDTGRTSSLMMFYPEGFRIPKSTGISVFANFRFSHGFC
jgi:hypothetical protein